MSREASCVCEWNGRAARVKAVLEPPELILRGEFRRRIPFAEIHRVSVDGSRLCLSYAEDRLVLSLGDAVATKWAQAISSPPPSLAKKLGILPQSAVRIVGIIDDDALREALTGAALTKKGKADLVVARVNTPVELDSAFKKGLDLVTAGAPLWIVYRKGRGHAINESDVRSAGLAAGIVDVKVASVSTELTALKFVERRTPRSK